MFCENCGTQIKGQALFCENCGASVTNVTPNMAAAAPFNSGPARPMAHPYPPMPGRPPASEEMTVGAWMLTLFICFIPLVGFIMTLVWAFGSGVPAAKRNYFRAMLIYMVIALVASVVFGIAASLVQR